MAHEGGVGGFAIIGVDAVPPCRDLVGKLVFFEPDQRLEARRIENFVPDQIPVPDAVAGAPNGELEALLALGEPLDGEVPPQLVAHPLGEEPNE